jgi:hypothetical protein
MPSIPPIGRLLAWSIALLAFWPLVSILTWVLPSEDGAPQLLAVAALAAAAAVRVFLSREPLLAFLLAGLALVQLFLSVFVPLTLSVLSGAGLAWLTIASREGLELAPWLGRRIRVGHALAAWFAAALYVGLSAWPYYVWPWSTIRADIAQQLAESAYSVPPPALLPVPSVPGRRQITHPLFRFPIEISLDASGPVGPNKRSCRMFFGDGRFAYVNLDDPRSFMSVGD